MEIVHDVGATLRRVPPRLVANGGYDRRDAFHVTFDPADDDVVEVVVRAVAVIHNTDPKALDPLAEAVDPDALEALVAGGSRGSPADVQVTFVYENLEITMNTDGNLWLEWA